METLDRQGLHTLKWEYEIEKSGDPALLSFGTADMDFPCAKPILDAVRQIADRGHLGYPYIRDSYYAAIENWLVRTAGWALDAKTSTATNVGIYTAVWTILDALTNPGDEIIIQTPVHFCFNQIIRDNGRVAVANPLKLVDGRYEMDFELLEKQFTPRTKLFWLCNPHNPVGRAWTRQELQTLADICIAHGVTILSDDVYCGLLYPGVGYTPVAALSPRVSQNTITCYSPSKSYNTTGVKFSYIVAENEALLERYNQSLAKLDLNYGLNIFGLAITEAAYNGCDGWLKSLMEDIAANHALATAYIAANLPGAAVTKADSTYFAWIDMRGLGRPSDKLMDYFTKNAHIVIDSGAKLGKGGEGFMRMNLACSRETLVQGLERLKGAYTKLLTG